MTALNGKELEKTTIDAVAEIKDGFASPTSQDPSAVMRFIGSEGSRNDAYQRVNTFLKRLPM